MRRKVFGSHRSVEEERKGAERWVSEREERYIQGVKEEEEEEEEGTMGDMKWQGRRLSDGDMTRG